MTDTLNSNISAHLPVGAQHMPASAIVAATNPQVLVNPAYHDQVVANAVKYGGQPAQQVLNQIFAALHHSLAVGIEQGLVVVLGFSLAMFAATLFLKDVPLRASWGESASWGEAPAHGASAGGSGGGAWGAATDAPAIEAAWGSAPGDSVSRSPEGTARRATSTGDGS